MPDDSGGADAMSLTQTTRRSGLTLIALGLLGATFFWLTDPWYGPTVHGLHEWYDPLHWLQVLRGYPANLIDAAHEAEVATMLGVAGSGAILLIGLWLLSRKRV